MRLKLVVFLVSQQFMWIDLIFWSPDVCDVWILVRFQASVQVSFESLFVVFGAVLCLFAHVCRLYVYKSSMTGYEDKEAQSEEKLGKVLN